MKKDDQLLVSRPKLAKDFWNCIICRNLYFIKSSGGEDIGVTLIEDGHGGDSVEFTAGGSELDIVSLVEEDFNFGQHGVILNLRLSDGRAVAGNEDQFGFSVSEGLQGGRVSQTTLSGSLQQSNFSVDIFVRV